MINGIDAQIKQLSYDSSFGKKFTIKHMETDLNHIHYMIEYEPSVCITSVVNRIKQHTTYYIWKNNEEFLKKHFWRERTFWTDGYFVCSIGNVSAESLKKYIENQG